MDLRGLQKTLVAREGTGKGIRDAQERMKGKEKQQLEEQDRAQE